MSIISEVSTHPVRIVTIVGKYNLLLKSPGLKPRFGQILRIHSGNLYYINVLKLNSRRDTFVGPPLIIDLKSGSQRKLFGSSRYPVLKTAAHRRACHSISSVVYFVGTSLEELAEGYLVWLETCPGIEDESAKPRAEIILGGGWKNHTMGLLYNDFISLCTNTQRREEIYRVHRTCFRDTHLKCLSKSSTFQTINDEIFGSEQGYTAARTCSEKILYGYCWTEKQACRLLSASMSFFATPKPSTSYFSIVRTLSIALLETLPDIKILKDLFQPISPPLTQSDQTLHLIPLLGKYLAYHTLMHSKLLTPENYLPSPRPGSNSSFFDHLFSEQYEKGVLDIIALLPPELLSDDIGHKVKSYMHQAILQYCGRHERYTRTHILGLQDHAIFFTKLQSQRICMGCIFSYCDNILPCHHGFCRVCLHNYSLKWRATSTIELQHCPVCSVKLEAVYHIPIFPPTAAARVLSLDGGGVKGIIEIEVLDVLSKLIGNEIPIWRLFDIMVGTSIGGIIALGMSSKQWSLDTCRQKLIGIASQLFLSRGRKDNWLETFSAGLYKYVRYATCLIFQDSLVYKSKVEKLYQAEFGSTNCIIPPFGARQSAPKIAVTTSKVQDSECSIITTYNRRPSGNSIPYQWLQEEDKYLDVNVFEAARCTSAVPFLLPVAKINSVLFQDGALVCNNPTPVALTEAAHIYGLNHQKNIVLNIGCGKARSHQFKGLGSTSRCFNAFSASTSAQKQYSKYRDFGQNKGIWLRIDPSLDMDEVSLDDYRAIPELQRCFSNALTTDVLFQQDLTSSAFRLLSSTFYLELLSEPQLSKCQRQYAISTIIRPRIPSRFLYDLNKHRVFYQISFIVNGKPYTFKMPKRINFSVDSLDEPIEASLRCTELESPISGFPSTTRDLWAAQETFYSRKGTKKRRWATPAEPARKRVARRILT